MRITDFRLHQYAGAIGDYYGLTRENRVAACEKTDNLKSAPEELHRLCTDATWLMIIDRKHPGEGYRELLIKKLESVSRYFGGLGSRAQAAYMARLLGAWDVEAGCDKVHRAIVPVRSLEDVR